jgi:2-oxo-4-hydroxy-4-carboxy-5-ureidoimidazoline decarboxylase
MDTWQTINSADPEQARRCLTRACGSSRWVDRMLELRPFAGQAELLSAARQVWNDLREDDWREAFSHHPQIGDRAALEKRFPASHDLSTREQAGIGEASSDVLDQLAAANQEYLARFGYIFIVCASGRSAGEMLSILRSRLGSDPATEIQVAASEQAAITALRLSAPAGG